MSQRGQAQLPAVTRGSGRLKGDKINLNLYLAEEDAERFKRFARQQGLSTGNALRILLDLFGSVLDHTPPPVAPNPERARVLCGESAHVTGDAACGVPTSLRVEFAAEKRNETDLTETTVQVKRAPRGAETGEA